MSHLIFNLDSDIFNKIKTPHDIIDYSIEKGSPDSLLLVVPTGRLTLNLKRDYIREFYRKTNGKPVKPIEVVTIAALARQIFNHLFKKYDYKFINEAYKIAIFEEAFNSSELTYYNHRDKRIPYNLILRLAQIVFGLKEDGITPEQIFADIENIELEEIITDKNKHRDIGILYKRYEEIKANSIIDNIDILIKVIDELINIEAKYGYTPLSDIFKNKDLLLFSGFTEFKHYESKLINRFLNCKTPLLINLDYNAENGPLFGNLISSVAYFEGNGFKSRPDKTDKFQDKDCSHSQFIRKHLFRTTGGIQNPALGKLITIYEAGSRRAEVAAIAKYIRHIVDQGICEPKEIAVALRSPSRYSSIFRDVFYLNRIPADISDRYTLSASPLIVAVFSVFDVIVKGWKQKDVHKLLKNNFFHFKYRNNPDRIIDSENIRQTAIDLKIIGGERFGGINFWLKRIEAYINANLFYLQENNDSFDDLEKKNIQINIQKKSLALEDLKELAEQLNFAKGLMTTVDFFKIINEHIINKLEITKNIEEGYLELIRNKDKYDKCEYIFIHDEYEKNVRALNEFLKLADEMKYIAQERYPLKKFTFADLAERLSISVQSGKYQLREKRGIGVTATSIEQLRGMDYKVIILCGLVDGEFPIRYSSDNFLGKELPESEEKSLEAEKMQFYQFLTSSENYLNSGSMQILLTFPSKDNNNDTVRSSFINSVINIVGTENIKSFNLMKPEVKKELAIWLDVITNKLELHKYIAECIANKKDNTELMEKYSRDYNIIRDIISNNEIKTDTFQLNKELFNDQAKSEFEYLSNKEFSISELETFNSCQFRYFAQRLLKLQQEDDFSLKMDAMEQGSVLHKILQLFYLTLAESIANSELWLLQEKDIKPKIIPVKLDVNRKEEYLKLLIDIATDILAPQRKLNNPFLNYSIDNIIGTNNKKGMLEVWLDFEIERIANNWQTQPGLFEMQFGKKSNFKAIKYENEKGSIAFNGKIDRIEFASIDDDNILVAIADYKSSLKSKHIKPKAIAEFKDLQMPIYIYAIDKILKESYDIKNTKIAAGVYYGIKPLVDNKKIISHSPIIRTNDFPIDDDSKTRLLKVECTDDLFAPYIIPVLDYVIDLKLTLLKGEINITTDNEACKYCKFSTLCRKKDFDEETTDDNETEFDND